MKYLWISPAFMFRFNEWRRQPDDREQANRALGEIVRIALDPRGNTIAKLPDHTSAFTADRVAEWKATYLDVADAVILLDFRRDGVQPEEIRSLDGVRALLLPDDVIRDWVRDPAAWGGYCKGLCDAAFLDLAKKRHDNFKFSGKVSSIFLPFEYRRVHMIDRAAIGLNVVLGDFDSMLWKEHGKTALTVRQPTEFTIDAWARLHQAIRQRYDRIWPTLKWKASPPAPVVRSADVRDTWISKEQLRAIQITDPEHMNTIMACHTQDDLIGLIDILSEEQWTMVDMHFSRHVARLRRKDETNIGSIAQYELNAAGHIEEKGVDFERWQQLLTPAQLEVVTRPLGVPIRVRGGPGTGKTLTAVLRAAHLLRQARQNGAPMRVGLFVFNRDLGQRIYQQFVTIGMQDYLAENAPQQLVVTNLMEWCERFLDLEALGVEPIAPYRADRMDRQREALFGMTIEEARRTLAAPEYEALWREFDIRSRNGLREIETEISQFIKARGIPNLTAYLGERRATQWLRDSEKEFRRFVWEVYQIYDRVLKSLNMVDADDLVNDCFRRVSQTVWQNYEKGHQGFDYLILDEAHDFFRHQILLLSMLVKDERNLMMCYDQGQMVYSRYPTLRELGHDSDDRFFSRRLEVNFRNSKQVLAALQALVSAYPVYDYNAMWGQISANPKSPEGPLPVSQCFLNDTAMKDGVAALVRKYLDQGVDSREIAVIGFDEDLLRSLETALSRDHDLHVHRMAGQGKRPPRNAIVLTSARQVKGEQFDVCILAGTDRDGLPDLRGGTSEIWAAQKREDDFRLMAVAMSRCKRYLHFVWAGTLPSEFIERMGETVEPQGY